MSGVDYPGAPEPGGPAEPTPKPQRRWGTFRAGPLPLSAVIALVVAVAGVGTFVAVRGVSNRSEDTHAKPAPSAAPPSSAAPAPSEAPPSAPPTNEGISFAATGDIIMGSTPRLPPNGGRTFFADVRPQLRGDVVMGNFEGALTNLPTSPKCRVPAPPPATASPPAVPPPAPKPSASAEPNRCFAFRMPPAYAQLLKGAGFGVVNLANNHTRDYGAQGLTDTRAALAAAGVAHTGAPGQITMMTAKGVKIAVLGFAPYSWTQSVVDVDAAAALVRKASAKADLVVVNMHAGGEGADRAHVRPGTEMFLGENRGDPMRFSRAVIDAGADLVVGHSPHIMRGMEWYKGRLIAYSLGNFAGYRSLSTTGALGIGGILQATLRKDGTWVRGALVGSHMVNGGLPALDPKKRAVPMVNALSASDFGATACKILPSGEIAAPAG